MRHTIRGLIIIDRQVLLVTGHDADYYWTPGGGVEPDETPSDTLSREISEELGVRIKSIVPYLSYVYKDQEVENFLIEVVGEIQPRSEITTLAWYESESSIAVSQGFKDKVLPVLLKDDLID